jgi:dolichol-phosphate mannosyltransferase
MADASKPILLDKTQPLLSVLVPVFNEEACLEEFYHRITAVLEQFPIQYEVVVSDNCSIDRTGLVVKKIIERDARWRYIKLSRNFGYQINITAGLSYCCGDAVVIIDADLQDPPELIGEFIKHWQSGCDVVYGVRRVRGGDNWWRRNMIHLYYRMLNRLSPLELPADAGDFRLISRRVQEQFLRFSESSRYLRGLFAYIGFKQHGVPYEREARFAGESKFPLSQLVALGLDGIISFSMIPLRIMLLLGLLLILGSILYAIFAVWQYLIGVTPVGWTTIIIMLLALSGVQILFLGLIGEYVGRIYMDVKNRPLWIVDEECNIASR